MGQGLHVRVVAIALFDQDDGLEWANNDDLLVDTELNHGLLWRHLDDWESILSPVLSATDIDPLLVGSGSMELDLTEVLQISDIVAKGLVVALVIISINNNNIEIWLILDEILVAQP